MKKKKKKMTRWEPITEKQSLKIDTQYFLELKSMREYRLSRENQTLARENSRENQTLA